MKNCARKIATCTCFSLAFSVITFLHHSPARAQVVDGAYADIKDAIEELIKAEVGKSTACAVRKIPNVKGRYFTRTLKRLESTNWGNLEAQVRPELAEFAADYAFWYALGPTTPIDPSKANDRKKLASFASCFTAAADENCRLAFPPESSRTLRKTFCTLKPSATHLLPCGIANWVFAALTGDQASARAHMQQLVADAVLLSMLSEPKPRPIGWAWVSGLADKSEPPREDQTPDERERWLNRLAWLKEVDRVLVVNREHWATWLNNPDALRLQLEEGGLASGSIPDCSITGDSDLTEKLKRRVWCEANDSLDDDGPTITLGSNIPIVFKPSELVTAAEDGRQVGSAWLLDEAVRRACKLQIDLAKVAGYDASKIEAAASAVSFANREVVVAHLELQQAIDLIESAADAGPVPAMGDLRARLRRAQEASLEAQQEFEKEQRRQHQLIGEYFSKYGLRCTDVQPALNDGALIEIDRPRRLKWAAGAAPPQELDEYLEWFALPSQKEVLKEKLRDALCGGCNLSDHLTPARGLAKVIDYFASMPEALRKEAFGDMSFGVEALAQAFPQSSPLATVANRGELFEELIQSTSRGDSRAVASTLVGSTLAAASGKHVEDLEEDDEAYKVFFATFVAYLMDQSSEASRSELARSAFRHAAVDILIREGRGGIPKAGKDEVYWVYASLGSTFRAEASGIRPSVVLFSLRYTVPTISGTEGFWGVGIGALDMVRPLADIASHTNVEHRESAWAVLNVAAPRVVVWSSIPQFSRRLTVDATVNWVPRPIVKCRDQTAECVEHARFSLESRENWEFGAWLSYIF